MKCAADAYIHLVIPDASGQLGTSPSTSPVNRCKPDDGQASRVCTGTAVERQIVWELFNNVILASKMLAADELFRAKLDDVQGRFVRPVLVRAAS